MIGEKIAEAMQKVGNEGVITVEEKALEFETVEGTQFDRGYVSPYFITNAAKMLTELNDLPLSIGDRKYHWPFRSAARRPSLAERVRALSGDERGDSIMIHRCLLEFRRFPICQPVPVDQKYQMFLTRPNGAPSLRGP
jgi:hypothetical protein